MSFVPTIASADGAAPANIVYANYLANLIPSNPIAVGAHKTIRIAVIGTSHSDWVSIRFGKAATIGQATLLEYSIPVGHVEFVDLGENDTIALLASVGVTSAGIAGETTPGVFVVISTVCK